MLLEEHPLAINWLEQMSEEDRPLMRHFLRSLYLVSHNTFEAKIREKLLSFAKKHHSSKIALFAITDPADSVIELGSVGRILHICKNLASANRQFVSHPNDQELKLLKVEKIVWIDDLIGSGKRVSAFYKQMTRTQKSLLSLKKCDLHIVGFQILNGGKKKAMKTSAVLERATFDSVIDDMNAKHLWTEPTRKILKKYSTLTGKPGAALGFRNKTTNIVFAHGCPNNAPVILWESVGPPTSTKNWNALFPGRDVPPALYEVFESYRASLSRVLENAHQMGDGLRIDRLTKSQTQTNRAVLFALITLLSVLKRRIRIDRLSSVMMMRKEEIDWLLKSAIAIHAISDDGRILPYGEDLLKRFRNGKLIAATKAAVDPKSIHHDYYLPKQYKGFQR